MSITLAIAIVVPVLAMLVPEGVWRGGLGQLLSVVDRLAERQVASLLVVGIVTLSINLLFACVTVFPYPAVQDEFGYLLTADTFAQGRLSNPTPASPEHFRSYHILVEPTYQSKYPPAQGLFLAVGQLFFGSPVWGVWLSLSLAAVALAWMLQIWISPRWGLIGGMAFGMSEHCIVEWGQTFWGGAVAFLGAALMYGAFRQMLDRSRKLDAIWLGVGVSLLANSRPYEGLLAALPVAILTVVVVMIAMLLNRTAGFAHYFAPAGPLLIYLCIDGARKLGELQWPSQHSGSAFVLLLVVALPILSVNTFLNTQADYPYNTYRTWALNREKVIETLEQRPGKFVVFVRYALGATYDWEWVYNGADLKGSKIIFVRDLGPEKNTELMESFNPPREAWLVVAKNFHFRAYDYNQFMQARELELQQNSSSANQ